MDINITVFWHQAAPHDYSASKIELGENAGPITWRAACDDAPEYNLLDSDEKREAFRLHAKGFGAWTKEELAAYTDTELNALLIQMISGDIREVPGMSGPEDWDWKQYEQMSNQGIVSGRLGVGDDPSQIYYYIGD